LDLYFAGLESNLSLVIDEECKFNGLCSYWYSKNKFEQLILNWEKRPKGSKLFVDSGAFTAWTKGKSIDVDEYIDFINTYSEHIELYGQIDVIPGDIIKGHTAEQVEEAAAATWENYLYMRPRMKKPEGLLYTFHVGEPYRYLEQALEWRDDNGQPIPYIALGGMVGKPMPTKKSFLDSCFNIIMKSSNPKVKVHAFGMTSFSLLEAYPITSADSTSWIMTGANGNIITDVGIIAISEKAKRLPEHYSHLCPSHQEAFEKTISKYGFTLDELQVDYKARLRYHLRYLSEKASKTKYIPGPKKVSLF